MRHWISGITTIVNRASSECFSSLRFYDPILVSTQICLFDVLPRILPPQVACVTPTLDTSAILGRYLFSYLSSTLDACRFLCARLTAGLQGVEPDSLQYANGSALALAQVRLLRKSCRLNRNLIWPECKCQSHAAMDSCISVTRSSFVSVHC